jgi:hypothetical protein
MDHVQNAMHIPPRVNIEVNNSAQQRIRRLTMHSVYRNRMKRNFRLQQYLTHHEIHPRLIKTLPNKVTMLSRTDVQMWWELDVFVPGNCPSSFSEQSLACFEIAKTEVIQSETQLFGNLLPRQNPQWCNPQ